MSDIRKQVMAHLIAFMERAEERGLNSWTAAEAAFPDVPVEVLAAASVELGERQTEAWWQSIEKTIDGEVIQNALEAPR